MTPSNAPVDRERNPFTPDAGTNASSPPTLADYQAIAARGLSGTLGIEIVDLSAERVVATMPVNDRTRQPFGVLHGGASMTLAETAASLGAWSSIDSECFATFALELNASHLRATRDGIVSAVATPVHRGRTTQVWAIEIRDEAERLVCIARCTMAVVAIDSGNRDAVHEPAPPARGPGKQ